MRRPRAQALRAISLALAVSLLALYAWLSPSRDSVSTPPPPSRPASTSSESVSADDRAAILSPGQEYIFALSWSPAYCASPEAQEREEPEQCAPSSKIGFVVHGLWPQFKSECEDRPISPEAIRILRDSIPSVGLIRHQWRKHGSCLGVDPETYAKAIDKLKGWRLAPSSFLQVKERKWTRAELIREWTSRHPDVAQESVLLQCSGSELREVRICLDQYLKPRPCSRHERGSCHSSRPIRVRPPAA
jgi:ribonuclease T2